MKRLVKLQLRNLFSCGDCKDCEYEKALVTQLHGLKKNK